MNATGGLNSPYEIIFKNGSCDEVYVSDSSDDCILVLMLVILTIQW